MGIVTVIWEKWVEFRFEWFKITTSALVSPLLYMVALGWGIGSMAQGLSRPYIDFLVPGIIALTTMNTSFSASGLSLNIQRLFEHSFEQVIASPTPIWEYIIGQAIGGSLRGVYSGCLIILLSVPFGSTLRLSPVFFLVMLLNGMVFSALGVLAAILARTHSDVGRVSTFLILPMTFLCNTIFPLERLPGYVGALISALPLTHASGLLRALAYGETANPLSALVLTAYAIAFTALAVFITERRKDL